MIVVAGRAEPALSPSAVLLHRQHTSMSLSDNWPGRHEPASVGPTRVGCHLVWRRLPGSGV